MLDNKKYKKRALLMCTIKQNNNGVLEPLFRGEDILNFLWNPEPDMDRVLNASRKLAQIKDLNGKPLFNGSEVIRILENPNLNIDDFIKQVYDFINKQKESIYRKDFFNSNDIIDVVTSGLSEKIFELPNKIDISQYTSQECVLAARFLDFKDYKTLEQIPMPKKVQLLHLYESLYSSDFEYNQLNSAFRVIPETFDDLEAKYIKLKNLIKP